ncbi:MAG: YkgJ family cysteine cluster protein [Planctomycetota bacterium]
MERRPGFPFAFACRRSGNCCAIPGGFVRVTDDEAAAIAGHLGLDEPAFRTRYLQPDGRTLKDGLGHRCVFLQDGAAAACSIYPARPQRCREWPFWPELLADAALRQLVLRTCPGIVADPDPS